MIRHCMIALLLTGVLAGAAVAQTPPENGRAGPKPGSLSLAVASAGRLVRAAGGTELRGVVVAIDATGPWQLMLQATTPDSTVSVCVREVHGPARALARHLELTRAGTPTASGSAGKGIRITFDFRLLAGVSPTIAYVIIPD